MYLVQKGTSILGIVWVPEPSKQCSCRIELNAACFKYAGIISSVDNIFANFPSHAISLFWTVQTRVEIMYQDDLSKASQSKAVSSHWHQMMQNISTDAVLKTVINWHQGELCYPHSNLQEALAQDSQDEMTTNS